MWLTYIACGCGPLRGYEPLGYKSIQSRCKQFHVIGLKNEENPKCFCFSRASYTLPRSVFGSFDVVLRFCKVNFHVVRSALQNSACILEVNEIFVHSHCLSSYRNDFVWKWPVSPLRMNRDAVRQRFAHGAFVEAKVIVIGSTSSTRYVFSCLSTPTK